MKKALLIVASCIFASLSVAHDVDPSSNDLLPVGDPEGKSEFAVKETDIETPESLKDKAVRIDNNLIFGLVVGCEDNYSYCWSEFDMPAGILDADGGEIRLILQHELNGHDMVRTIDIHVGCEYTSDVFGDRGRYTGRYCWARQVGGGEYAFVLGDGVPHNIFTPWKWAWITDYKIYGGNALLGGNRIRVVTHPHVTARVLFFD